MKQQTKSDARDGPDRATRRRELTDIARRWLIRYEADGFYLDTAPRLRFLTVPHDCFAVIAPAAQAFTAFVILSAVWGSVLYLAVRLI